MGLWQGTRVIFAAELPLPPLYTRLSEAGIVFVHDPRRIYAEGHFNGRWSDDLAARIGA